jgi:hypothetical protein
VSKDSSIVYWHQYYKTTKCCINNSRARNILERLPSGSNIRALVTMTRSVKNCHVERATREFDFPPPKLCDLINALLESAREQAESIDPSNFWGNTDDVIVDEINARISSLEINDDLPEIKRLYRAKLIQTILSFIRSQVYSIVMEFMLEYYDIAPDADSLGPLGDAVAWLVYEHGRKSPITKEFVSELVEKTLKLFERTTELGEDSKVFPADFIMTSGEYSEWDSLFARKLKLSVIYVIFQYFFPEDFDNTMGTKIDNFISLRLNVMMRSILTETAKSFFTELNIVNTEEHRSIVVSKFMTHFELDIVMYYLGQQLISWVDESIFKLTSLYELDNTDIREIAKKNLSKILYAKNCPIILNVVGTVSTCGFYDGDASRIYEFITNVVWDAVLMLFRTTLSSSIIEDLYNCIKDNFRNIMINSLYDNEQQKTMDPNETTESLVTKYLHMMYAGLNAIHTNYPIVSDDMYAKFVDTIAPVMSGVYGAHVRTNPWTPILEKYSSFYDNALYYIFDIFSTNLKSGDHGFVVDILSLELGRQLLIGKSATTVRLSTAIMPKNYLKSQITPDAMPAANSSLATMEKMRNAKYNRSKSPPGTAGAEDEPVPIMAERSTLMTFPNISYTVNLELSKRTGIYYVSPKRRFFLTHDGK